MEVKEIRISVPWGHIAGKTWGDESKTPILLFHGILDNAASFDRLIPHLPQNFFYVCIDLPGHGKSSYFPPFFPYFTINFILVYQLVMDYFGRKSYVVIGHSYGGHIAYLFTLLYPERVEKLVLLDAVHAQPLSAGMYVSQLRDKLNHILKMNKLKSEYIVPTYLCEEALERVVVGRKLILGSSISKDATEALLSRSLTKVDRNKYRFNADQRLKSFISPAQDADYMAEIARLNPIKCPMLIVGGSETVQHRQQYDKTLDLFKKMDNVQIETVYGSHDVHNDNPEVAGPILSKFLLTYKSKL